MNPPLNTPPEIQSVRNERCQFMGAALSMALLAAAFAGCKGTSDPAAGWVTASIRGSGDASQADTNYQGTGDFTVSRDPGAGVSEAFSLNSNGTGPSAGGSLLFYRPGGGVPGQGVYRLGPLKTTDAGLRGFTAYFHRIANGRSDRYTAISGEATVTASSGERIEGYFTLTGALYCSGPAFGPPDDQSWCAGPNTITPGVPQLVLTGSFVAVTFRPATIPVH